jgi:hypothetical protein
MFQQMDYQQIAEYKKNEATLSPTRTSQPEYE